MDFSFSEEQNMLRDLAREILEGELTLERIKGIEASGEFFDSAIWDKLAEANLLGLAISEEHGGMGFGFLEVCVLLEEMGRTVAPLPVLPTVIAALAIERCGSDMQRSRWLPRVASGQTILSVALADPGSDDPAVPATLAKRETLAKLEIHAKREERGWRLSGTKRLVSAVTRAERILVPALVEGAGRLFLLDPAADGVRMTRQLMTHREPVHDIVLEAAWVADDDALPVERVGREALAWLHDIALVANCAMQVGVSSRALEITADYVRERVQFGRPIGSFQAVQHRCADRFIDLEAMRWTLWRAACSVSKGRDVRREAMVAKFWAAEGGARIASTAQHLHAGHGVDLEYAIHRYFTWTKALELSLGSAIPQLVRLGADMARTGPQETP
jgi:alkylation response protein AidB-like acyl-CoA dehydrogenase